MGAAFFSNKLLAFLGGRLRQGAENVLRKTCFSKSRPNFKFGRFCFLTLHMLQGSRSLLLSSAAPLVLSVDAQIPNRDEDDDEDQ